MLNKGAVKMKIKGKIHFCQVIAKASIVFIMFYGISIGNTAFAKSLELSFVHHLPPISPTGKAIEQWAKRLEAETDHQIKISIFPSGIVAKGHEVFSSIGAGMGDIGYVVNMFERSKLMKS